MEMSTVIPYFPGFQVGYSGPYAADSQTRQPRITPSRKLRMPLSLFAGTKFSHRQRGKVNLPRGGREVQAGGKTIVPGFVDVHIHGAGGRDDGGNREALEIVAATGAARGSLLW